MYAERGMQLDQSIDNIQRALRIEPENGYFIDSLGWAYYKKGLYKEALTELLRATELVPNDPIIQDHLGDIYFRLRRFGDASKAWRRSLSLDPKNAAVQEKLQEIRHLVDEAAPQSPTLLRP
jgi:Flp pilus assembly protein TadD